MKKITLYIFSILSIIALVLSCEEDDGQETIVNTLDLELETFPAVVVDDIIGTVFGTSNNGSVTFSISSQNPVGAISLDQTGNILVADTNAFSTSGNVITAEIGVSNNGVEKVSNISITVLSCPEDLALFVGQIQFESSFGDNGTAIGTIVTGNTCAIQYTGVDPLFSFLDCTQETSFTVLLSPSEENPNIGNLIMERQAYGCSDEETQIEVEGTGSYNLDTGEFIIDYTIFRANSEFDSLTLTVTDGSTTDTDGDGVFDTDEIANGSDANNPCDPIQNPGYSDFNPDNIIWGDADCDGDGALNIDEFDAGTDPYDASDLADPTDTDGDGITDVDEIANGSDENDPCDPMQSQGFSGFDETNSIWIAADCDGDGTTNGDEFANGTDPYFDDSASGSNMADTSIWEGDLDVLDGGSILTTTTGSAGDNVLDLTGDWIDSFFCEPGNDPITTITFIPNAANNGTGTITMARQPYAPCFPDLEIEGTGTYDENTGVITIDYEFFDTAFDPNNPELSATLEIRPQ